MTLARRLTAQARATPGRDLLRMPGRTLTYGEFEAEVNRLANGLLASGVKRGERVGVMLPNCPEFALLWLALLRIGAVAALVNTAFRGSGLAHVLDLSGCRLLVVDESFLAQLAEVRTGLARLERVVTRDELGDLRGPDSDPGVAVAVEEPAQVFFTSGTTGRSKACLFDQRYAVRQGELFCDHWRIQPADVLFNPFPLFHIDASVLTLAPAIVRVHRRPGRALQRSPLLGPGARVRRHPLRLHGLDPDDALEAAPAAGRRRQPRADRVGRADARLRGGLRGALRAPAGRGVRDDRLRPARLAALRRAAPSGRVRPRDRALPAADRR
jgi:hypothetical protein